MPDYFVFHTSHVLDTGFRLVVGTGNVGNQLLRIPRLLHFFTDNLNTTLPIAVKELERTRIAIHTS